LKVSGGRGTREVTAGFDLEVMEAYVSRELAEAVGVPVDYGTAPWVQVNGRRINVAGFVALEVELDGYSVDWCFRILDDLDPALILGAAPMRSRHIVLNQVEKQVMLEKPAGDDKLKEGLS
jgi:hypothetical protein